MTQEEAPQSYQPNETALNSTDYHSQLLGTLWRRVLSCLHPAHPCYAFVQANSFANEPAIRDLFADQNPQLCEAVDLVLFIVRSKVSIEKFEHLLFLLEHPDLLGIAGSASLPAFTHNRLSDCLLAIVETRYHPLLWEAFLLLGHMQEERAVKPLLASLTDSRAWVRLAAAYALGNIGDKRAVEPLLSLLHEERDDLRWTAIGALERLKDDRASDSLLNALLDPCQTVRRYASNALRIISSLSASPIDLLSPYLDGLGDPIILAPLLPAILTGDEQAIKQKAASLVEPLLAHLKSDKRSERRDAVLMLGKIGDPRAIAPLVALFAQQDLGIQTGIIDALERIDMPPATRQQAIGPLVDPLLAHLRSKEPLLHPHIVQLLGKIGDSRVVPPLLTMLTQQESDMQVRIIKALEQIGIRHDILQTVKKQVVDILLKALLARFASDDEAERVGAVQMVGEIGHQRSIFPLLVSFDEWFSDAPSEIIDTQAMETLLEELIIFLSSEKSSTRLCAIQALGKFKDRRAVSALTAIFAQQDSAMQSEIVDALEELGVLHIPKQHAVAALVEPLVERLSTDDRSDRARIVQMLGKIGDRRAVPALLSIFTQQDAIIQVKIVDALEQLRMLRPAKKHAVAVLMEPLFVHLNSEDSADRLRAVQMLGKIGDQRAVNPLLAIFAQQDPITQVNILDVVDRLGTRLDTFQAGKRQAVEALLICLNADSFDRLRIVQLLGKIGDERAVVPLLIAFAQQDATVQTEDPDEAVSVPTIRAEIITALEQIDMSPTAKQQALASLVEPLITRLSSGNNTDFLDSIQLLGKIGDERAVTALFALFDKPFSDMQIETQIIAALERIGMRLDILQTVKQHVVDTLVEYLCNDKDFNPWHTVEILSEIGDQRIVEPLLAAFAQQKPGGQSAIIDVLREMGMPPVTEQQALGSLVEILIAHLNNADWFDRRSTVQMLGKIGYQRAVEPLLSLFAEEDVRVQAGIIEALERIDLPQVARFVPYLLDSQDRYLRVRGVWALAQLYGSEAIPQLTTLRDDPAIGQIVANTLRDLERVSSETINAATPLSSDEEELSLEERKQREYQRGRVMALDPEAQSTNDDLPAFMAPPNGAPAYYGFVVLQDVEVEGFYLGKISDFEAMPDMVAGDAFIIAPDNSRAGLVWELAEEVFVREIGLMGKGGWGVWSVGFLYPMTTRDNMRRNLQNLLPTLREEWKIWQEYYL